MCVKFIAIYQTNIFHSFLQFIWPVAFLGLASGPYPSSPATSLGFTDVAEHILCTVAGAQLLWPDPQGNGRENKHLNTANAHEHSPCARYHVEHFT